MTFILNPSHAFVKYICQMNSISCPFVKPFRRSIIHVRFRDRIPFIILYAMHFDIYAHSFILHETTNEILSWILTRRIIDPNCILKISFWYQKIFKLHR